MKSHYLRFKKWVEQKKIQKRLDKFVVVWIITIAIVSIGLSSRNLSGVLGLSTEKEAPSVTLPSSTIAIPTDTPTPTTVYVQPTLAPQVQQPATSKIDCVGPDGKHFNTTQKECDDFNAAWKKPQQNNQPQQPDWKTLVPYYGSTQNISQNQGNNAYTPPQNYSCIIYNPTLKTYSTYNYIYKTKEECDVAQQEMNQNAILYQNPYQYPTENTASLPDNSRNQQLNGQCRMYADQWYANQGTQCSGSCTQAAKQIAYPEYQQKLRDCDSQYPI